MKELKITLCIMLLAWLPISLVLLHSAQKAQEKLWWELETETDYDVAILVPDGYEPPPKFEVDVKTSRHEPFEVNVIRFPFHVHFEKWDSPRLKSATRQAFQATGRQPQLPRFNTDADTH
jgi:hypothetical protein